jgi:hypothetical protein
MVFKQLTDRLRSAGNAAANTLLHGADQAEKIQQLTSMGFPPERARHALNATGGDVDRAAELLLLAGVDAEPSQQQIPSHAQEGTHVAAHNDEQMRIAIEESLRVEQQTRSKQKQSGAPSTKNDVIDLTGEDNQMAVKRKNKPLPDAKKPSTTLKQTAATTTTTSTNLKSAAAINAGKAATARHLNPNNNCSNNATKTTPTTTTTTNTLLNRTHPNIQLPEKMSNKSKEEQILRCANRLKSHVMAVDTLLRALISVRSMPDNAKFRVIDRNNSNYITHVKDKPGAEDMLLAMNYRPYVVHGTNTNELRLERQLLDDALLYLGISALEQMRKSTEYIEAKKLRTFHAEMKRLAKPASSMTENETTIRLAYMSNCPKEPPEGRGARLFVQLGDDSDEKIEGGCVSRRFDGDDTLEDVLNWLGGCYGNVLLEKLRGNTNDDENDVREWCLCDMNVYPILPLDVEKHAKKTLQYLGLFPSGKLVVRLSDDAWKYRKNDGGYDIHGSARGLGAASRSMLH